MGFISNGLIMGLMGIVGNGLMMDYCVLSIILIYSLYISMVINRFIALVYLYASSL